MLLDTYSLDTRPLVKAVLAYLSSTSVSNVCDTVYVVLARVHLVRGSIHVLSTVHLGVR